MKDHIHKGRAADKVMDVLHGTLSIKAKACRRKVQRTSSCLCSSLQLHVVLGLSESHSRLAFLELSWLLLLHLFTPQRSEKCRCLMSRKVWVTVSAFLVSDCVVYGK